MDDFIQQQCNMMRQTLMRECDSQFEEMKRHIWLDGVKIDKENDILSYVPDSMGRVGVYVAGRPLTPAHNYFEIEVLDTGVQGAIVVGLVPRHLTHDTQPGKTSDSVAYRAADGRLYKANSHQKHFGPKCEIGDRMGCGIRFDQVTYEDKYEKIIVSVFFTKNGKEVGTIQTSMPDDGLFPAVGLHSPGEEIKLHMDAFWSPEDETMMSVDGNEDEWCRLHDVQLKGTVLEYAGHGKTLRDVGLAQTRSPLDTTSHYFELEIIDPGENCYIAIGLAHRGYPKDQHPGWIKGSIAYHADDGKIFLGSGIGDPFGPRCHKGDVMGCGIIFPQDYICENDYNDGYDCTTESQSDSLDEFLELEDYHSESEDGDEEWWKSKEFVGSGVKVEVFFTRNGKTIGRKEIRIPKGGLYPTVGMLSINEKVKVDLRPLSG